MARVIDVSAWKSFYEEHTRELYVYDPYNDGYEDALNNVDDWIDAQTSVKCGRWIRYQHGSGIFCSICRHKRRYRDIHDNYCPNCGNYMQGDGNG